MSKKKLDYIILASASDDELEELMLSSKAPKIGNLKGWEFKGYKSLDVTTLLGFRKFKKGFFQDGDQFRGYNVKVKQNGLIDPWIDLEKGGVSVKHGWYDVYPVKSEEKDNLYPNALMLNYSSERNPKADPSRFLRDYLVQVDPKNPNLLLGKAYVALGPKRVFVSYFILEKENESAL